tara:strand:+ start:844 stop:1314 length:471 start_codon:yes stop_codon:yes gene_type:complete
MNNKDCICTEQDPFLEDKSIWIATLASGVTVYQDDYRANTEEPIAWKRLREYCQNHKDAIELLRIKFRSHVVPITPKKIIPDYYYFAYGITKNVVSESSDDYYLSGFAKEERLHYSWYKIPELIKQKTNTIDTPKDIEKDERFIPSLELTKKQQLL